MPVSARPRPGCTGGWGEPPVQALVIQDKPAAAMPASPPPLPAGAALGRPQMSAARPQHIASWQYHRPAEITHKFSEDPFSVQGGCWGLHSGWSSVWLLRVGRRPYHLSVAHGPPAGHPASARTTEHCDDSTCPVSALRLVEHHPAHRGARSKVSTPAFSALHLQNVSASPLQDLEHVSALKRTSIGTLLGRDVGRLAGWMCRGFAATCRL